MRVRLDRYFVGKTLRDRRQQFGGLELVPEHLSQFCQPGKIGKLLRVAFVELQVDNPIKDIDIPLLTETPQKLRSPVVDHYLVVRAAS